MKAVLQSYSHVQDGLNLKGLYLKVAIIYYLCGSATQHGGPTSEDEKPDKTQRFTLSGDYSLMKAQL